MKNILKNNLIVEKNYTQFEFETLFTKYSNTIKIAIICCRKNLKLNGYSAIWYIYRRTYGKWTDVPDFGGYEGRLY